MKRLYRSLCSLQTGIILLALITAASLAGVIIPQGLDPRLYIDKWGKIGGNLLLSFGMDRLFSTLWYQMLLGFITLNTLLCTVNRMRSTFRALAKSGFLTPDQIGALQYHRHFDWLGNLESHAGEVVRFFGKRRFMVSVSRNGGTVAIDARKGNLREIGSALLHLGLLPLLAGGLIGKVTGFSYLEYMSPGETRPVRERPFFVKCDFFDLERNEEGAVKDYKSGLTILDSAGGTVAKKVIEVNHPLVYRGIKMYQSSYRTDPSGIDDIRLVVNGPLLGSVGRGITLQPEVSGTIEGSAITVTARRFIPDFVYDMETKSPQSRSDEHHNPAIHVTLANGADTLFSRWVFQKFGAMHHEKDDYSVSFQSYNVRRSTGLLIKRSPGSGLVWSGIILMSLGILLVFWVPRRRCWAVLSTAGEGAVAVEVGSMGVRDEPDGGRNSYDSLFSELDERCRLPDSSAAAKGL